MSMDFTIARIEHVDGREIWWHGHADQAFNLSNANGFAVLRAIGIEPDSCGAHDAADVHARCVAFRAAGDPAAHARATSVQRGSGATMVSCGISADGIMERVGRMEALAEQAMRTPGGYVGWS